MSEHPHGQCVIRLTMDASELDAALNELNDLLEASEFSPKLVDLALNVIQPGAKLLRVDMERSAASGTSEVRALLQPSDALANLLSTIRARYAEGNGVV